MEFEWDPKKAEANLRKHGIPFSKATLVFQDRARLEMPQETGDSDEERWKALGCVEQTVLVVIFTLRGDRLRLISARKADRYEQGIYWNGEVSS